MLGIMEFKQVVLELAEYDDKFLLQDVAGLTKLHEKSVCGKGVIFSGLMMRRLNGQFPHEIETKSMAFDEGNFYYDALRDAIEESKKNTMLVYRDSDGELVRTIYLGEQLGSDPFTRVVYTDKLGKDVYCANRDSFDEKV